MASFVVMVVALCTSMKETKSASRRAWCHRRLHSPQIGRLNFPQFGVVARC
jgi:hypothetical protein